MYTYLQEVHYDKELLPFASISDAVRDSYDVRSIGNAVPKSFLRRLLALFEDEKGHVFYAQKPETIYMINRVYGCKKEVLDVFAKIDKILEKSPGVIVTIEDNEYVMSRTMPKRIAIPREKMKRLGIEELL
ncbi:hypothetical protein D081_0086 [Anaerovibrio sp. JC8]|uniref:hypothetical protein n=1 Tax=Anaerovibrio sp. JC8 TaxID=1240085 RepID=UPI000A0C14F7|nr:hypothetical protein [Anaerovibrio sp. JC8]ORU01267.1 hypothetical protein D081_0086 [Anaerovibrio sp. JC8]